MPRSATKGRKAETIRTVSGYETRVFNGQRAVLFVSCWGGKHKYQYTYHDIEDAQAAAAEFNKQPNTEAHAEVAFAVKLSRNRPPNF